MSDTLDQLDEIERDLAIRAADAEAVKDATLQPAFRLLMAKAKASAIEARNGLVSADPNNAEEIRRLQNEVKRYEDIAFWVRAALQDGEDAFRQLQAHRNERDQD